MDSEIFLETVYSAVIYSPPDAPDIPPPDPPTPSAVAGQQRQCISWLFYGCGVLRLFYGCSYMFHLVCILLWTSVCQEYAGPTYHEQHPDPGRLCFRFLLLVARTEGCTAPPPPPPPARCCRCAHFFFLPLICFCCFCCMPCAAAIIPSMPPMPPAIPGIPPGIPPAPEN